VLHVAQRWNDGSSISDYLKRTQLNVILVTVTETNVDRKSSCVLEEVVRKKAYK
jgi:hypothetical protein